MIDDEIPAGLDGERVDRVVAMLTGCSRAEAAAAIDGGTVRLDGGTATKGSQRVAAGQRIEVDGDPVRVEVPPEADPSVEVDVVYEEQMGDPAPAHPRWFVTIDAAVFAWNHVGAAGVAHLSELHEPSPLGIGVREPLFAAAPSGSGPAAGASFGAAADLLGVSTIRDADVAVFADYEAELMHR